MSDTTKPSAKGEIFLAAVAACGVCALAFLLVLPNFIRPRCGGGQLTACKSNLKNFGTALEMYAADHSGRMPPSAALLTPNYLKTMPICPRAGKDTYSATYQRRSLSGEPSVYCPSHWERGPCANYPRRVKREAVAFHNREGRWPTALDELALDSKLTHCPYGGAQLSYSLVSEGYTLCCGGANHTNVNVPADRPAYNNSVGLIER